MKYKLLISALAATSLLGACNQKPDNNASAPANAGSNAAGPAEAMSSTMPANMVMPSQGAAKKAKGAGTVTAIDEAAGTITLDHGPIKEANWPAMTMAFKAAPALRDSVKVGDKVSFELKLEGSIGEITAITKK